VVARFRFPIFFSCREREGKRALRGEAEAEGSFEDQSLALEKVQGLTERSGADAAGLSEGLETERSLSLGESRQVHRAGEKTFVDFAGQKPHLVDPQSGEWVEVELFVGCWGRAATSTPRRLGTSRSDPG
jgi:hypothetical protein